MRPVADDTSCFPTGRHYPGIAHLMRIVAQGLVKEFDGEEEVSGLTLVSIDTETTGKDPEQDRIVEIAAVVWKAGQIVGRHVWLVNPGCPIPQEAIDVHGIQNSDVAEQPSFVELTTEILAVLAGAVPVAYNADFDRRLLLRELAPSPLARDSLPPAARQGVEWIDPLVWARELQAEEKSRSLSNVAERVGAASGRAHRALADAEACLAILERFLGDARVPKKYGAFIQEQRRLKRVFREGQARWRRPP